VSEERISSLLGGEIASCRSVGGELTRNVFSNKGAQQLGPNKRSLDDKKNLVY
jgi:hypothetical protein